MKYETIISIMYWLLIVTLGVTLFFWSQTIIENDKINKENFNLSEDKIYLEQQFDLLNRKQMYRQEYDNLSSYNADGVAWGTNYFCVWTKDRSEEEISDTILHEWLHIKLNKNEDLKKHFVGD